MAIANSFYDNPEDLGAPLAPALSKGPDLTLLDGGEILPEPSSERPDLTLIKRDGTSKSVKDVLSPEKKKTEKVADVDPEKKTRALKKAKKTQAEFQADHDRYTKEKPDEAKAKEVTMGPQSLKEQVAFVAGYYGEKIKGVPTAVKGEILNAKEKARSAVNNKMSEVRARVYSALGIRIKEAERAHRPLTLLERPFEGETLELPKGNISLMALVLEKDGNFYVSESISDIGQLLFVREDVSDTKETIAFSTPWELFVESDLKISGLTKSDEGILQEAISDVVDGTLLGPENFFSLPNEESINLLGVKFEKEGVVYVTKSVSSIGQVICLSLDGEGKSLLLNSVEDLILEPNVDFGELSPEQEAGVKAYISTYVDQVIEDNRIEKRKVNLIGAKMESPFEGEILVLPNGASIDLLTLTLDHNGQEYRAMRVTDLGQLVFWETGGSETITFASPWDLFVSDELNESLLTEEQMEGLDMIEIPDFVEGMADKPFNTEDFTGPDSFQNYPLPNGETINIAELKIKRGRKVYELLNFRQDFSTLYFIDKSRKGDRSRMDGDLAFTTPRELFEAEGLQVHSLTVEQIAGLTMMGCHMSSSTAESWQDRFWSALARKTKSLDKGETIESDIDLEDLKVGLLEFSNRALGQTDPDLSLISNFDGIEGMSTSELTSNDGQVYAVLVSLGGKQFYVPVRPEMTFHAFGLDDQVFELHGTEPEDINIRSIIRLPEFKLSKTHLWELERQGTFNSSYEAIVPEEEDFNTEFREGQPDFVLPSLNIIELENCVLEHSDTAHYEFGSIGEEGAIFRLVDQSGTVIPGNKPLVFKTPHELLSAPLLDFEASFAEEMRTELAELGYEPLDSLDLEGDEVQENAKGARKWLFSYLAGLYFSMQDGVFEDEEPKAPDEGKALVGFIESDKEELEVVEDEEVEEEAHALVEEVKKSKAPRRLSGFWGLMSRLYMEIQAARRVELPPRKEEQIEKVLGEVPSPSIEDFIEEEEPLGPPPVLETPVPTETELMGGEVSEPETVGEVLPEPEAQSTWQDWFFGVALRKAFGDGDGAEEAKEAVLPVVPVEEPDEVIPEADIEVISTEAISAAEEWNRFADEGNGRFPRGYKISGKNRSLLVKSVQSESRGGSYLMPSTVKESGTPALVSLWFDVENPPADMEAHSLEDYELVKPAWVKDPNNIGNLYAPNDVLTGKPDPEILEKGTLRYVGPQA